MGHSHVSACMNAYKNVGNRPNINFEATFAIINDNIKWLRPLGTFDGDEFLANPAIMNILQNHGAFLKKDSRAIVAMINGNEHTTLGLLSDGTPIDFFMPGETTEAPIIPANAVRKTLEGRCSLQLALLKLIHSETSHRVVCVESPPPPQSNEWILDNLDNFFVQKMEQRGWIIARPDFRRKLWLMRSEVIKATCKDLGIDFVPVPDRILSGGFLKEEYLGNATHGNTKYGAEMLIEIDATLAQEKV